jgi:glycosyltransferase involved in cell wall biosynthesis
MTKILAFDRSRKNSTARSENRMPDSSTGKMRRRSDAAPSVSKVESLHSRSGQVELAVSIVIPTRGRPQLLNRCIASLVLQRFDPALFEIVVVDDGAGVDTSGVDTSGVDTSNLGISYAGRPCTDTREVVAGWAAHTAGKGPLITYIPSVGPRGPAAARNHGWRAARAPIIAFTDDDTIARTDWLKNGVDAFKDEVDAVCGRIVMPLNGTPTDYELDAKNLETAEFVTANCFCRKQILEELGGFDERFRFAWREDSDLHFRLLDYQANIVHEPKAVMMHPIRPAAWGVSLSQVKKVQFDALLFKKHPLHYRHKIRAMPRWDFYVTVGALLVCVVALLVHAGGIALLSGMVWLLMTGRFCVRRLMKTSKSPSHVAEMLVTSALIPPLAVFWRAVGAFRFRVGFL